MPLYEYACDSCGAGVERLRKYRERELAVACPSCGGSARPVMSAAAVIGSSARGTEPVPFCESGPACCGGGCQPD